VSAYGEDLMTADSQPIPTRRPFWVAWARLWPRTCTFTRMTKLLSAMDSQRMFSPGTTDGTQKLLRPSRSW